MATVQLAWNANTEPDLAGYRLYRVLGSAAEALLVELGKVVTYQDATVPNVSQTVTYRLSAFDTKGNESPRSAPASVTVDVSPPQAPTGLSAVLQ